MDRKVTITNAKGQRVVANIVTVLRIKELNGDYVVYTFNQKDESGNIKDYVSKLRLADGNYYFDSIKDQAEWEKVKNIILEYGRGVA
ncbi:MAG: DUF1292 domain-containing protein [Bacilli bacterium]|nr:DUF1292 domain-containing protein [Bacilli bacterium]